MNTPAGVRPERRTTRDQAASMLREMLLAGRFAAGEPIREQELAAAVGASRGPVREAMIQLAAEGLLRFDSYRGNAVINPDIDDVRELFTMRGVLEGFAASRAAADPNPGLLAELSEQVTEMRSASASDDRQVFFDLDLAFHETVVRMAAHRLLLDNWLQVRNRFALTARFVISDMYDSPDALAGLADRHQVLIDPIAAGDAARARRLAEDHPLHALQRYEIAQSERRSADEDLPSW